MSKEYLDFMQAEFDQEQMVKLELMARQERISAYEDRMRWLYPDWY